MFPEYSGNLREGDCKVWSTVGLGSSSDTKSVWVGKLFCEAIQHLDFLSILYQTRKHPFK